MWEIVFLAAPTSILLLFLLPETSGPTLTAKKLAAGRTADQSPGQIGRAQRFALIRQSLKEAIVKPAQICIQDPAVAVANLYTSFIYGTYYTFFESIPRVYLLRYGFTIGQLGLVFLSIFVACFIAGSAYCIYISRVAKHRLHKGRTAVYEDSLRPALVASFLLPAGLFMFGWTTDGTTHWIVGVIGITIYCMGTFTILQCLSVYLPKIYPEYSASLFAANDISRSIMAAAAVHFAVPLYADLGIESGNSVLGGLSVLGIAGMWLIYRKGAGLRARTRFGSS
jgi:DHA1 family multidrug resistance protein-like MFS transporter